jgi:hypothetical protein
MSLSWLMMRFPGCRLMETEASCPALFILDGLRHCYECYIRGMTQSYGACCLTERMFRMVQAFFSAL